MVRLGSIWGQPWVNTGSMSGQQLNMGSTCGQPGINRSSTRVQLPGVDEPRSSITEDHIDAASLTVYTARAPLPQDRGCESLLQLFKPSYLVLIKPLVFESTWDRTAYHRWQAVLPFAHYASEPNRVLWDTPLEGGNVLTQYAGGNKSLQGGQRPNLIGRMPVRPPRSMATLQSVRGAPLPPLPKHCKSAVWGWSDARG